jgi:hypothetical protein
MKMQLTQDEIKAAIARYVNDVIGIDLSNNSLAITFSATRLEGTIAYLDITTKPKAAVSAVVGTCTPTIPGYSEPAEDVTAIDAPALAEPVADPGTPEVAAEAQAEATLNDPVQLAETMVEAEPEVAAEASMTEEAPVAEVVPKKSTATLFGKPATAA